MDGQGLRGSGEAPKTVSRVDLLLVAAAVIAIICANVGVVRALDVALDAVHDQPAVTTALNR
ncbi:hypothetical protein AMST5_03999 [freshwater sediment metagenome]|uniref:Uncharacterized protein n=1 Tax=freshwater sediment metagenome TaxID=556182 RepID=A0AA48RAT7_9ZZZZ